MIFSKHENHMVRATALDGKVRALAVDSTAAVRELARLQTTGPAATAALGRVATATLLLSATLKKETHLVTVRVKGDGPLGVVLASANGRGEVRETGDGKLNVSGAVGSSGRLTVVKDLGLKEPYHSTVELVSGEIGKDMAYYFARSEQQPSAVGLGVYVDRTGAVEAAGGYLIQILGGLDEDEVERIETRVASLPHPTTMIRGGEGPEEMLGRVFGHEFNVLDRSATRFRCPCNRERAERALILLGPAEIDEIMASQGSRDHADVTCEFCGQGYRFTLDQLAALKS